MVIAGANVVGQKLLKETIEAIVVERPDPDELEQNLCLDKGYAGTDSAYPDVEVQQPLKVPRKGKLTPLGRAYNHLLSVLRIPVEHHFARLQKFGCLAGLWRGAWEDHEDTFCIISGILNFKASGDFNLA